MKKFIAVITAVTVMLCFTACGGRDKDDRDTAIPATSDVLVRSVYDEISGSYYNAYTRITVTPPGDWYVYRDSDLAASYLNGEVTGDELSVWGSAEFEKQTVIPDLAFQDMANSNNLSVVYVNLDNLEGDAATDENAFHALVISHLNVQGKVLNQTDDEIVAMGDKEFYLFRFKGDAADCYMAMRKQDNYVIVITATDHSGIGEDVFFGFVN